MQLQLLLLLLERLLVPAIIEFSNVLLINLSFCFMFFFLWIRVLYPNLAVFPSIFCSKFIIEYPIPVANDKCLYENRAMSHCTEFNSTASTQLKQFILSKIATNNRNIQFGAFGKLIWYEFDHNGTTNELRCCYTFQSFSKRIFSKV